MWKETIFCFLKNLIKKQSGVWKGQKITSLEKVAKLLEERVDKVTIDSMKELKKAYIDP